MDQPVYKTIDKFDRIMGSKMGAGDSTHTKPATVQTFLNVLGESMTHVVQTFRDEDGDTVFIQYMDSDGRIRMVLPPGVVRAIIRQHEALTTKVRKRVAKEQAQARKARGEVPGFMKSKKGTTSP